MIFTAGGKTDRGLVRANNEDRIFVNEKLRLAAVADGMGGHASGETASKLALETLRDCFQKDQTADICSDSAYSETTNRLGAAVTAGNRVVYEAAQKSADLKGMGTTIAAAAFTGNRLSYAHVGDSRIYLVRSGSMEQLTEDHSVAGPRPDYDGMVSEEATQPDVNNILTRAVGIGPDVQPELGELTVFEGDILLLCTDGLYNTVPDAEILKLILRAGNVRAASEILIDAANENGGMDNISAVVCYLYEKKWYTSFLTFLKAFRR